MQTRSACSCVTTLLLLWGYHFWFHGTRCAASNTSCPKVWFLKQPFTPISFKGGIAADLVHYFIVLSHNSPICWAQRFANREEALSSLVSLFSAHSRDSAGCHHIVSSASQRALIVSADSDCGLLYKITCSYSIWLICIDCFNLAKCRV